MRTHRTTIDPTSRAWRVVTHHNNDELQRQESQVELIQSYELALRRYKDHDKAGTSVELRDPSGRMILDSESRHMGNLEPDNDGLLDAPAGRYAWVYDDGTGANCDGRFMPMAPTKVQR